MKLRFLCAPHRIEISNQPTKAIYCWQNSSDTAQDLCDQAQYKEALPYLGSAFETAEIIMTIRAIEAQRACELFSTSAVLFAGACAKLDYTTESLEIYWMTINRLEKELGINGKSQPWVNQHLEYFYESVQCSDFTGRQDDFSVVVATNELSAAVH